MADVKIKVQLGAFVFEAEGAESWVEKQLTHLLEREAKLGAESPGGTNRAASHKHVEPKATKPSGKSLALFLKDHDALKKQNLKFLATSVWLEDKGNNRLNTGDVVKALKDNNQSRVGNPSQCLANNIQRGLCERDGDSFFVTEEGRTSLTAKA